MNRRIDAPPASRAVFSGAASWIALFAVVAVFSLSGASLRAQSANSFFKRGQSAEAREDYDAAFDNFQKACKKDGKNLEYRTAFDRVRLTASAMHVTKGEKLFKAGNEAEALTEFLRAAEIDPSNEAAQQAIARVRKKNGEVTPASETSVPEAVGKQEELESMGAPVELRPVSNEPLTLHMTEDAKVVYQAVGKAAGVNVLFDPDFTSKRIQVDLNNVSLLDALRIVGALSKTYWRPITENTIYVADSAASKRRETDEQAVQTFYLSNAWQQSDLTDVQTAIRNLCPNVKLAAVASQNAIVIRGTLDELLLAQKLINDLDKARPEVVVDIAILEVSKNWERTLGISWPTNYGIALQAPGSSSSTTSTTTGTTTGTSTGTSSGSTPTLYDLSHLKAYDFAVTVGSATANMLLTDSNTKILQNPRLRATDGQKATFKVGSKIPIATGSYGGGGVGTGALGGISSLVNTQFQYTDVGVNIEMTPTVHFDRDVTLKMKIEVTSQSGSVTISQVTEPILSQRVVDQVIRLREGEASILGGIQDRQDQSSWTGLPGLSSIPILKYLFGSKDQTVNDDELVFLVVPHVVRSQSVEAVNLRTVDTGEGASVEIRRMPSENPGPNPVSSPGSNPAPNPGANPAPGPARPPYPLHQPLSPRPNVGTVPGQSAMAAGPAALEQIRKLGETSGDSTPAAAPPASPPAAGVSLTLNAPPGPVPAGTTFSVPVVLTGGTDIAAVPVRISYDPAKLSLVNVDKGDFLGRDGQAWDLSHRDDPPGLIVINAERTGKTGISGAGEVFVLSFRAKAAGESAIEITHPGAVNSTRQQVPVQGGRVSIQVK
jgi:general secretion pathway protein D